MTTVKELRERIKHFPEDHCVKLLLLSGSLHDFRKDGGAHALRPMSTMSHWPNKETELTGPEEAERCTLEAFDYARDPHHDE